MGSLDISIRSRPALSFSCSVAGVLNIMSCSFFRHCRRPPFVPVACCLPALTIWYVKVKGAFDADKPDGLLILQTCGNQKAGAQDVCPPGFGHGVWRNLRTVRTDGEEDASTPVVIVMATAREIMERIEKTDPIIYELRRRHNVTATATVFLTRNPE